MLRVRVGVQDYKGTVNMTFTSYLTELSKDGGKRYVEIHCAHGIERFRIKYLRNVMEVSNG